MSVLSAVVGGARLFPVRIRPTHGLEGGILSPNGSEMVIAGWKVDLANEALCRGAEVLRLRPKTWGVLHYLLENPNRLVGKRELLDAVWPDAVVTEDSLTRTIREIRRAIGDSTRDSQFLRTIHGRGYQLVLPDAASRDGAIEARSPAPSLTGRAEELARLQDAFDRVLAGERRTVFVSGDAGIGKTTLVDAFVAVSGAGSVPGIVATGRCIDHHGPEEPRLVILEALMDACRGPRSAAVVDALKEHAPTWLRLLSEVGDVEDADAQRRGATEEGMLRELANAVDALTASVPLILILEDLQWSDGASLDVVSFLSRRRFPSRLLLVGTLRNVEAIVRAHPSVRVMQDLTTHDDAVEVALDRFTRPEATAYLQGRLDGDAVPDDLARRLYERTEGHPLFLRLVVDYLESGGRLERTGAGWHLTDDGEELDLAPDHLKSMIRRQLDSVGEHRLGLLQQASVVGLEFQARSLAGLLDADVEAVERICDELTRIYRILRRRAPFLGPDNMPSECFAFSHSLYREVLYDEIPQSRRRRLHRTYAEHVERDYGLQVAPLGSELALHYERAGLADKAVSHHQLAAGHAMRHMQLAKACHHLGSALRLVTQQPASLDRDREEAGLRLELGVALTALDGPGSDEVAESFQRVLSLNERLRLPQLRFAASGLCGHYLARTRLDEAAAQVVRLHEVAREIPHPAFAAAALGFDGSVHLGRGELAEARDLLERAIAVEVPATGPSPVDITMMILSSLSTTLACLGREDEARAGLEDLLERGSASGNEYHHGYACYAAALGYAVLEQRHDVRRVVAMSEAPEYASRMRFLAMWAARDSGDRVDAVFDAMMSDRRKRGEIVGNSMLIAFRSDLHRDAPARAVALLDDALDDGRDDGEHYFDAELYRRRGELRLAAAERGSGASDLERALEIARAHGAALFAKRARDALQQRPS